MRMRGTPNGTFLIAGKVPPRVNTDELCVALLGIALEAGNRLLMAAFEDTSFPVPLMPTGEGCPPSPPHPQHS